MVGSRGTARASAWSLMMGLVVAYYCHRRNFLMPDITSIWDSSLFMMLSFRSIDCIEIVIVSQYSIELYSLYASSRNFHGRYGSFFKGRLIYRLSPDRKRPCLYRLPSQVNDVISSGSAIPSVAPVSCRAGHARLSVSIMIWHCWFFEDERLGRR